MYIHIYIKLNHLLYNGGNIRAVRLCVRDREEAGCKVHHHYYREMFKYMHHYRETPQNLSQSQTQHELLMKQEVINY
jgi:hypothetical protein